MNAHLSLWRVEVVESVIASIRVGAGDSRQSLSFHLRLWTKWRWLIHIILVHMRILMLLVGRGHRCWRTDGSWRGIYHRKITGADDCDRSSHWWKWRRRKHRVVLRILLGLWAVPVILILALLCLLTYKSHKIWQRVVAVRLTLAVFSVRPTRCSIIVLILVMIVASINVWRWWTVLIENGSWTDGLLC